MSDITFETAVEKREQSLNKYELLQSERDEVKEYYNEVFEKVQGSYTTVSDNDLQDKFKVAIELLEPSENQVSFLKCLSLNFLEIESLIDPVKLQFDISRAIDHEIVLSRRSEDGISNIIINDDGSIAFSFIAYKNSSKADVYQFYDVEEYVDCQILAFTFFSK